MPNLPLLFISLLSLALLSCIEQSTVIKVKKDGSGIVHVREYVLSKTNEESVDLPDDAKIQAMTARMGAVRLQSVKKSRNTKGWHGHEIVFEFDDINGVVLPGAGEQDDSESATGDKPGKGNLQIAFKMENGILEVTIDDPTWQRGDADAVEAAATDSPTIDPYAGSPGPPASQIRLTGPGINLRDDAWKAMSNGMRVGYFLQIDDPIAETNATYQDGELFTLVNLDMGKIVESGTINDLQQLRAPTRDAMEEIVTRVPGLEMDLQHPIRFKFE